MKRGEKRDTFLGTVEPLPGGGFRIRNVNFRERSDGRSHEHYHSVGLAQARPNYCAREKKNAREMCGKSPSLVLR